MRSSSNSLLLQMRLVNPERAAAQLDAVTDEIVGQCLGGAGIALQQRLVTRRRASEGMVDGVPALFVLVPLDEREVGDPEEAPGVFVDQLQLATELEA